MADLVKISKMLRQEAQFAARARGTAKTRARSSIVRADYALPSPVAGATPTLRIEAPALAPSFQYVGEATEDCLVWRRRRDADQEVRSYIHSAADWEQTHRPHPLDPELGVKENAGRASEMTTNDKGKPLPAPRASTRIIPPSKRVRVRGSIAPAMARGAEMLITDRGPAESRPAFTRRHPHIYALARSATYVSSLHALREAILRPIRVEFEIANCRRHVADARMALGSTPHKILSERLP